MISSSFWICYIRIRPRTMDDLLDSEDFAYARSEAVSDESRPGLCGVHHMNVFDALCAVHPGLHLPLPAGRRCAACRMPPGKPIFGTDDNVLSDRLHRFGQDGGSVFSHPDPARMKTRPHSVGVLIHRPSEGAHQRPVRTAERAVRGSGDPGDPLAWGRASVPKAQAAAQALRHSCRSRRSRWSR